MQGSNYATAAAPPEEPHAKGQGKPVFVMHSNIPGERRVELEEMYKAICKAVDTKDIHGIQKVGGLWRLYINERQNRIKLITEGIQIRDTSVRVYDKNPYLPHDSENTLRVLIKDIPLSVHESIILDEFESKNLKVKGPMMYPKLRVDGKLTQCLTGDRVLYVEPPTQPIPRFVRFHSFKARVFHAGQPDAQSEVVCSHCLQAGHHRSRCNNEMVCRLCRNVGHMQSKCPTAAATERTPLAAKPKQQTSRSAYRGDATRGDAITPTTDTSGKSSAQAARSDLPTSPRSVTSSPPQTRSQTANKSKNREHSSKQTKESVELEKVLADFRSRSNSAPNIGDAQMKITRYMERSISSESDESEEEVETDDDLTEASLASTNLSNADAHQKHKHKSRKRKRKNGRKP